MIVTLEEVKNFLKITDTSQDQYLSKLQEGAEAYIKENCGREFENGTHEALIWVENEFGFLPDPPVTDITSVINESGVELTSYTFTPYGTIKIDGVNHELLSVTYTGGSVPNDIKLAVLRLIEYLYQKAEAIHSQNFEGVNVTFSEIPNFVREVLDKHKVKRL